MKCLLFGSGKGSSIKTVINSIKHCDMPLEVESVVFNKSNYEMRSFCEENNVNYNELVWNPEEERSLYEHNLLLTMCKHNYDFIFLLGWNMIMSTDFIKRANAPIYNLHPSLPNQYIGDSDTCLKKALQDFNCGLINFTGSMVHRVTEDLDRGEVMSTMDVPMYCTDTLDTLRERVKQFEKPLIVSFLADIVDTFNKNCIADYVKETTSDLYIGKVRRVENIKHNCLLLSASDRLSAFDEHICNVPDKGVCLNKMSRWWFEKTRHIIDNHYLHSSKEHMIVRKTNAIKLEIVVRGYMTGASSTSIWTMYSKGERNIYGINFRDGYSKNDKLDEIIITPTTKGKHDIPITPEQIVNGGYLTQQEYDFISGKALELFKYGQKVAREKGFVLVDTKYEFGKLPDNSIILIDELHTCDSSRYWFVDENDDYTNPRKIDKDIIREYVKQVNKQVPNEIIEQVSNAYKQYLELFNIEYTDNLPYQSRDEYIEHYFKNIHNEIVVIMAGSYSDSEFVKKIVGQLNKVNIYSVPYFHSAHKNPKKVLEILEHYDNFVGRKIVYVTVAGRSNALSGVVASNCKYPVIACPPFKDKTDFQVNINSTLQMPSNVPVMTILEPLNVALSIKRIFSL